VSLNRNIQFQLLFVSLSPGDYFLKGLQEWDEPFGGKKESLR
jgi:hypothetical protein